MVKIKQYANFKLGNLSLEKPKGMEKYNITWINFEYFYEYTYLDGSVETNKKYVTEINIVKKELINNYIEYFYIPIYRLISPSEKEPLEIIIKYKVNNDFFDDMQIFNVNGEKTEEGFYYNELSYISQPNSKIIYQKPNKEKYLEKKKKQKLSKI